MIIIFSLFIQAIDIITILTTIHSVVDESIKDEVYKLGYLQVSRFI